MKSESKILSEGVIIINDTLKIIFINLNANNLFGYYDSELLGASIETIIPTWRSNSQIEKANGNKFASSENFHLNTLKKNGDNLYIQLCLDKFREKEESLNVLFVSELLNTDEKNCDTDTQLKSILLILDNSINISLINKYCGQFLGSAEDMLKGLNWPENFLPVENIAHFHKIFEQTLLDNGTQNYETPLLTLRGERYTIHWTNSTIYNSNGAPIGTLCAGLDTGKKAEREVDLTHLERIKKVNTNLELKLRGKNQELFDSLTKVETINLNLQSQITKRKELEKKLIKIQQLYDAVVHNFPDGVIGVLNRNMEYVLIDGKDLNDIILPELGLHGNNSTKLPDSLATEDALEKIKKAFDGQNISFEVTAKDRFYHISAVPLPDETNTINEILCVLKNITERKKMEDGLLAALEKEKELGELRSRFVTMASHEFKTPLATILSSNFLLENFSDEDYQKKKSIHTNRIKRSVSNLTMILNEFLSIERLEENQIEIKTVKINIQNFILELINEVEPTKQKGQRIEFKKLNDEHYVFTDPHVLWSILTNLISNALKYSREGDTVLLTCDAKEDQFILRVKDNGIGIPEDEMVHIFERFYRTRNVTNFKGTGLGLHIVEKNIELLKGTITVKSTVGVGTEFTVCILNKEK